MKEQPPYLSLLSTLPIAGTRFADKIREFRDHLLEVNLHINLISRNCPEIVVNELIYDSLAMFLQIEYSEGALLMDMGSGAGFPWIIHKIVRPDLRIVTIDSNWRKIEFQKSAGRKLQMSGCIFISDRIEKTPPVGADYAIAKALGTAEMIASLAAPHLNEGGRLLLPRIASESTEADLAGYLRERILDYQSTPSGRTSKLLILKKI